MTMKRKRNAVMVLLAVGMGGAALAAPAPAAAQVLAQQAAAPKVEAWQSAAGVRTMLVRSAGYDPFATSDVMAQFSVSMQRVLVRSGAFAFAAGVVTEFGLSSADARSASGELQSWHAAALGEGRYQPWQRGYGFVRVAPGVLGMNARLTDASAPNQNRLEDGFLVAAADFSGGAAVRLGPPANPVSVWLSAEGGYAWAASHHLLLSPAAAPRDQAKLAPVDLGTIEPRGAFMRVALVLAY